jgi:hypothetical protein
LTHEEAVGLLTDYVTGRLSGPARDEVQAHFEACDECRGLLETVKILAVPLREDQTERGPPGHPASADLVAFALHRDELSGEAQKDLAAHLGDCRPCRHIVTLVTQTEEAAVDPFRRPSARGRVWQRGAVAAAAVAMAGLAWLGLYRLPLMTARVAVLEEEQRRTADSRSQAGADASPPAPAGGRDAAGGTAPWPSGPIRVQSLPEPRRSSDVPPPKVTLTEQEPTLYLSVEPPELPGADDRLWMFDLSGPDGATVWSWSIAAGDLRRLVSASPETVLAIPADRLDSGGYVLRLRGAAPGGELLQHIRFEVKKSPAPAR